MFIRMKITATLFLLLFFCWAVPPAAIAAENAEQIDPALELIHALGCKGCHMINGDGGSQSEDLTQIGSRMTAEQIKAQLTADSSTRIKGFMPSYNSLPKDDLQHISDYLYILR